MSSELRKLKRPLPLTISGSMGLVEGEAWWMDATSVVVVSRERFAPRAQLDARVDLGTMAAPVDLIIKTSELIEPITHRGSKVFRHEARYTVKRPEDAPRLQARLAALVAPPVLQTSGDDGDTSTVSGVRISPGDAADPPSHSNSTMRRARTPRARRRQEVRRNTRFDPAEAYPVGTLAPGDPPALLLCLLRPRDLHTAIKVNSNTVQLTTQRIAQLGQEDAVMAVLQLPTGAYVQLRMILQAHRAHGTVFLAEGVEPVVLGQIRVAMDAG